MQRIIILSDQAILRLFLVTRLARLKINIRGIFLDRKTESIRNYRMAELFPTRKTRTRLKSRFFVYLSLDVYNDEDDLRVPQTPAKSKSINEKLKNTATFNKRCEANLNIDTA